MTHKNDAVVCLNNVSKHFEDPFVPALTKVNFEVYPREVFGLLGPRGSGKSTALRIIAGRLRPSEGNVKVFGHLPKEQSIQSRIAYLPEKLSYERSDVFSRIASLAGRLIMGRKRHARAEVGISDQVHFRNTLLARMLARNPDLVILDEPFAMRDSSSASDIINLIISLRQLGKTVVISSDSLRFTKEICTRMAFCFQGKVEVIGDLEDLLTRPEAIRSLGSLLPPATAQRVLELLRGELKQELPQPICHSKRSATTHLTEAVNKSPISMREDDQTLSASPDRDFRAALTKLGVSIAAPSDDDGNLDIQQRGQGID